MGLNMLKLCVGAESLEDLQGWSKERLLRMKAKGEEPHHFHVTRMVPKRMAELIDGGSLYWVIKGQVQARQELTDIVVFTDTDGIRRCKLMLANEVVPTQWQPRRAFQGWRYLKSEDAPVDVSNADITIPPQLYSRLSELGLL